MIGRAAMPLGAAFRVAALALASLCCAARAEVANRIVATIDGEPITAYELREWTKQRDEAMPEDDALQSLITEKLLEKEIQAQGIGARDEDVDRYVKEVQARSGLDDPGFARALAERGMDQASYRKKVKGEIERAQLVNKEIRQRVNVSPAEIRRYYEANRARFATSERVTVRALFVRVDDPNDPDAVARARARAEELRDVARDGRSFADLAREHSEGPGADRGGELGTFARGEMQSRLEEVAFALDEEEVSDPVASDMGFALLYVEKREAGGHRPLEEVSDEIREALYGEALNQRFQDWLSRDLRERHHVEVLP
jgi:peptidyl-prolyl cis-trans isomerase SurA